VLCIIDDARDMSKADWEAALRNPEGDRAADRVVAAVLGSVTIPIR
jgi:hypothetical protein